MVKNPVVIFSQSSSIILKNFISILSLLTTFSCVSVQQQMIDSQNEKLSHYEPLKITISKNKFIETLNPETNDQIKTHNRMERNFQSGFSIPGYGSINAGKLTRKFENQSGDPFEILQDNLLFTINFGGGW